MFLQPRPRYGHPGQKRRYRPDVHVNVGAEEAVLLLRSPALPPQVFILEIQDSVQRRSRLLLQSHAHRLTESAFTGCAEAWEEEEERLTFTLQQYLSFSRSSRPSSSRSSRLSSLMWGCSDALARTLSLRRPNAAVRHTFTQRIPKTSCFLSERRRRSSSSSGSSFPPADAGRFHTG